MIKYIKNLPLSVNILAGMGLGLLAGFLFLTFGLSEFVRFWIQPWGEIFLNLLKLIAIPIVFLSIVCGIFGIGNLKDFSKLAGRTFLLYIFTTVFAISVGLILVNSIKPGKMFDKTEQADIQEKFGQVVIERQVSADEMKSKGPLQFLVDIVPDNIMKAMTDNTKMLQIIFVAMMLGLVILLLPDEKSVSVRSLFVQLNDIFVYMVELFMKVAPFGVFALMAGMMVEFGGSTGLLKALGMYALTVVSGLLFITFIVYPLVIRLFTKITIPVFLKGIFPAQIVAFSTSSSAVTLPVTKRQVEKELGVSPKVSGFVLPLGMTINMDGTSLYQVVAVVFISQVFGIELSFMQQMFIILLAVLSSIGAPGIPGGSIVMLIFILTSVGIPLQGLALILGIDRPLDMLRTVTNVTGDSVICCLQKDRLG
jgi:proton glutamate symport protein